MDVFEPCNPDYAARVRASFARQKAVDLIGARLTSVEPGAVEIALDYRDDLTQQHGFVHGGLVGMIADNACGYAAFSLMPAEATVLTVEYKINFLAPAAGERLIARGRVLKPGRTLMIVEARVAALAEGRETLVATALATIMQLDGRADEKAPAG
jgi:uncharacterized protein (TIGR00369 family)